MIKLSVASLLICMTYVSKADSPLTSTFFANVYKDYPLIEELLVLSSDSSAKRPELKEKHLQFFDHSAFGLDVKIALVNAFSFGESGNLEIFKTHLIKKYKLQSSEMDSLLMAPEYPNEELPGKVKSFHYHDLVLLSYIQAMHDYFNPVLAMKGVYKAAQAHPESGAAAYVFGLIMSQIYFDVDWCMVYTSMQSVREGGNYSIDILRKEAIEQIFAYIDLYRSQCIEDGMIYKDDDAVVNKYTADYWKSNPVFKRPEEIPQLSKGEYFDLVLLNKPDGPDGYINQWINYDELSDGTRMVLSIANNGNIPSLETNMQIEVRDWIDEEMITTHVIQERIPVLDPGTSADIEVIITYYWIYDPDADFVIRVDFDNIMNEKNEKNNSAEFHEAD